MIKAAGSGGNLTDGGIHALAGGTAGAQYNAFPGYKVIATGNSPGGNGVFVNNANSNLSDYNGTGATGATPAASLTFGQPNNLTNEAFINSLRNASPTAPTITTSGTLTPFSTTNGTASSAQSFTVNGTNLTANITATAPASFEVSTVNATSGFAATATITQSGGNASGTVFVRLAASAAAGTPSGNITLSSAGATNRLVAVSGNVTAPVSGAPVVTGASFNGTVGAAFSQNVTATNAPNTFSSSPALPAGLTLNSTTGAITGTPTAAGNSSVVISATNGNGTGNATFSFNIARGTPTITTQPTATPIRVGQTLSNSTLSGGVASVNGTFAFTTPTTAPTATGNQSVSFTPTDSANWSTATTNVSVTVNPAPTINVTPGNLTGFSTKQNAASANQTLTVNGTNLEGPVTLNASTGYQISTDGVSYSSSLTLSPTQASPVTRAATIIASDTASNYGTPASNTWGNGSNAGTGFQPWLFNVVANSAGTPLPAFYAGAFIGDPTSAGITNMPSPAFGLYANPGGTNATATVSRAFTQSMAVGDSFSFQWATNWDSDVGNKGFNVFAGGNQVVNVNQAGFPGNITLNGELAIDGASGYGSQPMTWTFTRTTATNLLVTSTPRSGGATIAYSTNVTISAAPEGFSFYTTAMGQGDQRQPYFNNLQITSGGSAGGGNLTNTTVYVRLAANGTPGAANGNLTLTSANATSRTVTLSGTVIELTEPGITSRTINGTVGSNLTASINATNSPSSHTANGTLPPGVSFNATTGVFSGTPTTAGNYTLAVTATNADGTGTGNLTFAIAKGTPLITTQPTASTIRIGQTLANSILTGGNATGVGGANLPGNFSFTSPSTTPSAGTSNQSITFTPSDSANWTTASASVPVTVLLITPPDVPSQTLDGSVGLAFTASVNATNAPTSHAVVSGTLPAGLSLNATTGILSGTPSAAGNFTVTINATNGDGTGSGTLTFLIAKGAPLITVPPTASQIGKGQTLSNSTLTGGTATGIGGASLPGVFTFASPSTQPPVGNSTHSVTFTPADSSNWNTASTNVTVRVSSTPVAAPVLAGATFNATVGDSFSYNITATNAPDSYGATALPAGLALNRSTGRITGTFSAVASNFTTTINATNVIGTGNATLRFHIAKGTPVISIPPVAAAVFVNEPVGAPLPALSGGETHPPLEGTFTYANATQSFPAAGNYSVPVIFTPVDSVNWNTVTGTITVEVQSPIGGLSITADPALIFEGDDLSETMLVLSHTGPTNRDVVLNLSESPAGELEVDLSGNLTFVPLPPEITIPAGSDALTLYVRARKDSRHASSTSELTISHADFGSDSEIITILPKDFAVWSGNRTRTPEEIQNYAIGGAVRGQTGPPPVVSVDATQLSIQAIIRTHDPKLSVIAESSSTLSGGSWQQVPGRNILESDLGDGTSLRTYIVPLQTGETRKFLRFRIHLQQ